MSTQPDSVDSSVEEDPVPQPYLQNIAIWAADFPAMRRFYSEVIGLPEGWYGDRLYPCVVYQNGSSPMTILLAHKEDFVPEQRGWAMCPKVGAVGENWDPYITFFVPDIHAVVTRCKAEGIIMRTDGPFDLGEGHGLSIEVKDPDGNAVALTQPGQWR
ncbi:MAG TPA: VOC family protein [Candidatus Kapabacteria bacterium]|nr:VOC family protein [Candidatus Kapabacteria bacterium]